MYGIGEDGTDVLIERQFPNCLQFTFAGGERDAHVFVTQPYEDLACAYQVHHFSKHQFDGLPHALIGILFDFPCR